MIRRAGSCRCLRRQLHLRWLCMFFLLAAGPIARGQVSMQLVQAGFSKGAVAAYREGCWTAVTVELQQPADSPPFSGRLQIVQPDRDGDQAASELPVALAGGGEPRRYTLYTVPRAVRGRIELSVRLLDEGGGQACSPARVQQGWVIRPESICVLDLSHRPLPGLDELESADWVHAVSVFRLPAPLLPRRWFGLEAADVILWDEPRLDRIDAEQLRALAEWVRGGGTLVVGIGASWQSLVAGPLGELLPVTITASTQTESLPTFASALARLTWGKEMFPTAAPGGVVTLACCRANKGANLLLDKLGVGTDLLVRGHGGWGRVVTSAAPLRELVDQLRRLPQAEEDAHPVVPPELYRVFYELLIGLHRQVEQEDGSGLGMRFPAERYDLYQRARGAVGMQVTGGLFFAFASLFVIGYVMLATVGLWAWLKRRQWMRHNWMAFALCAVAASLLGVAAVQALRGARRQVHELAVVDGMANTRQGRATGYFGIRTPTFARVDVDWPRSNLDGPDADPPEINFLRPMPVTLLQWDRPSAEYMAPQRYLLEAHRAGVSRMPVRATLKQLEGYWAGELPGLLRADLEFDRGFILSGGSWIHNRLGVGLSGCWLIVCTTDDLGSDPTRPQERRRTWLRAFELGNLADGERIDNVQGRIEATAGGGLFSTASDEVRFDWVQSRLASSGGQAGQWRSQRFERALWLLTTYAEYDIRHPGGRRGEELLRSQGRRLDRSALLDRNTALLIGFARAPGPSRLRVDGRRLIPSWSCTAYRFVLPVRRREGAHSLGDEA